MESRQRKSQNENTNSKTGIRNLSRAILVSGIRDLGFGDIAGVPESRRWRRTLADVFACQDRGWDPVWIDSIFSAVEDLHRGDASVRKDVTAQCVRLLKALDDGTGEHGNSRDRQGLHQEDFIS